MTIARPMTIAVFENGWWRRACEARRVAAAPLPVARGADGNVYAADVPARLSNGEALFANEAALSADFWLDNAATGLAFVPGRDGPDDLHLAHERAGRVLFSHLIDPVVTTFQGMPWEALWTCLQSRTWIKAVWDRAQARELAAFGVPAVAHLPMAAANRRYATEPLDEGNVEPVVSFVGGQNTTFFTQGDSVPTESLLPGTLAQAVVDDLEGITFYDVYHDLYRLADPPGDGEDVSTLSRKARQYYSAKLFYNAALCVRNRDRYVIFLSRKLGGAFHLYGTRWDAAYGLPCIAPLPTEEAYLEHFRRCAININLVNGNAETGLNMRHFEITAAGGFMLCQDRPELHDCFAVGRECDVFRDEEDLLEKVRYYLEHPRQRVEIAAAGQRRTLSEHLFSHRLGSVMDTVSALRTCGGGSSVSKERLAHAAG